MPMKRRRKNQKAQERKREGEGGKRGREGTVSPWRGSKEGGGDSSKLEKKGS